MSDGNDNDKQEAAVWQRLNAWLCRDFNSIRIAVFLLALAGMGCGIWVADSALATSAGGGEAQPLHPLDRILMWAFVIFVVGLAELFVLLVLLAVFGRIDLGSMFREKEAAGPTRQAPALPSPAGGQSGDIALQSDQDGGKNEGGSASNERSAGAAGPSTPPSAEPPYVATVTSSVSLSRLQAFLWTLIVLVIYFHEAVRRKLDGLEGLPEVPPDLLLVMGISGALYLTSRQMTVNKGRMAQAGATGDAAAKGGAS
jgi:hypothetical protein